MPIEYDLKLDQFHDDSASFPEWTRKAISKWLADAAGSMYLKIPLLRGDFPSTEASMGLNVLTLGKGRWTTGECRMVLTKEYVDEFPEKAEGFTHNGQDEFVKILPARFFWAAKCSDGREMLGPEIAWTTPTVSVPDHPTASRSI